MKAEEVMEWAEISALFFRSLIGENVPPGAAVKMTCTFLSSLILAPEEEEPVEPWEEGD